MICTDKKNKIITFCRYLYYTGNLVDRCTKIFISIDKRDG